MKKLSLLVSFVLALVLATSVLAADEPILSIDFANGDNGMELVGSELVEDPTRGQVLKVSGKGAGTCGTSYALYDLDPDDDMNTIWNDAGYTFEEGMTIGMWIKTDVGSTTLLGSAPIFSFDSAGIGYYSVVTSMQGTINSDGNDTSYGLSPRVWNDPDQSLNNATEEGVWQHLVLVYSPEGQQIWLDGELVNEPPVMGGWSMDDLLFQFEFVHGVRLGSWLCSWWNNGDYEGMIDDVVVYNTALDRDAIRDLGKASKIEQTVFEEAPSLEDLYDGTVIDPIYVNNFDDAASIELVGADLATDAVQGNVVEINGAGAEANGTSYAIIKPDMANTDWSKGLTVSLKVKADASETMNGMAPLYSFDIARIGYIGLVTSLQSGINTDGNETDQGISPRLWNDPASRDTCKSELTAGQWQTVTVTYGESGMHIYLDGEEFRKAAINNGTLADLAAQLPLTSGLRLGSWLCDWWKYGDFEGQIDDVTLYNVELNPLQVRNAVLGVTAEAETEAETEPAAPAYPSSGVQIPENAFLVEGELIGNEAGWGGNADAGRAAAFDGDINTFFDPLGTGDGYAGMDAGKPVQLIKIVIHPRTTYPDRYNGAQIDGSNDPDFAEFTTIYKSEAGAEAADYIEIGTDDFAEIGAFRYYRYYNTVTHGDVAEVEFYAINATVATEADVEVVAPAETEAETADVEVDAPQTFDLGVVAIFAAVLSLGTALVSKKRR